MCEVQPAVRSTTLTRSAEVTMQQQQQQHQLPPGFLTLSDQQYRTIVFQEPIELYYEICPVPICTGQWASVYKCLELSSGDHFAAKFCSRARLGVDSSREIMHEVAAMYQARGCGRVVRLHQVFETQQQIVLVMELGSGGDLQGVLDADQVPYEPDVVRFVTNLLEGLVFLHDRNIAHLDIKPQNLVLVGSFPECDIKLCDLEISRLISAGQEIREMLGTPDYVAPEILRFEPVTLSADVWSVGVLAYVLLTGFTPFGGDTDAETFRNIARAELEFPDELFEDVSDSARDFIRSCLRKEPRSRPTSHELLRHDWLRRPSASVPRLVLSPSELPDSGHDPSQDGPDARSLRRSISKSREVLSVKVIRSNLKKNISKSRERLCDMKFSGLPMRPDQFPSCLRSSVLEVPDHRPPWKGSGVQKASPGSAKAERVNTFKVRDEYQNQVTASLATTSQPQEGESSSAQSPFPRQGSLRGRRKAPMPEGSAADSRSPSRRSRNNDSALTRRNSCQQDGRALSDAGKKKGPKRTQSVSDAIMSATRNCQSRKELLLPLEEYGNGVESVDKLDDGQEMVRIRPGTFVIDMGEQKKLSKMKSFVSMDRKLPSGRDTPRKISTSNAPGNGSRSSFQTRPSVEIQEAYDGCITQTKQRQPSPDTRKKCTKKSGSQPAASPYLAAGSISDRQTSPRRRGSPGQGSPRRHRDMAEGGTRQPVRERKASLMGSSRRPRAEQTTTSRPGPDEDGRQALVSGEEEAGCGLRKSSTDEDMQRLSSEEQAGRCEDHKRPQKSTDELTSPTSGRRPRRSHVLSRNVSSPLLGCRSPTSDLGSSDLSGDDWDPASGEPAARSDGSSVARAVSRFQALEQDARQGPVSPGVGRSPTLSRKCSSPVLRSPDPARKASSLAPRSPGVTRKASSPTIRSPCITRKVSSPAVGSISQRERGYPSRAPGLRTA